MRNKSVKETWTKGDKDRKKILRKREVLNTNYMKYKKASISAENQQKRLFKFAQKGLHNFKRHVAKKTKKLLLE